MKKDALHTVLGTVIWLSCISPIFGQTLEDAIDKYPSLEIPPVISRESFVSDPVVYFPTLSPNGKHLAFAEKVGKQFNLNLMSAESKQISYLFNTNRLQNVSWSPDGDNLILELDNAVGYFNVVDSSRPSYVTNLDRNEGDYFLGTGTLAANSILTVDREGDTYFLNQTRFGGSVKVILETSGLIEGAVSSSDGEVWYVKIITTDRQSIYELRDGVLTEIVPCDVVDTCQLDYYADSAGELWLSTSSGSDLSNLYSWSASKRNLTLKHSDPRGIADIQEVVYLNNQPIIAQYHDSTLHSYGIDQKTQSHIDILSSRFGSSNLSIESSNNDIWFIRESASTLREENYYLYELATKAVFPILSEYRSSNPLDPQQLSSKIPFRYAASDGMQINAYVSLPKGRLLSSTPLVALVHGGPWGRDDSRYNQLTQMLVNRGYIVFSPNFRASKGYGRNYVLSANKDFGDGVVQQDIMDGIQYLHSNGIGNPERMAIVGSSFGGFSALTGLAFRPGYFKVGIALSPPADMENVSRYVESKASFGEFPLERELHRLLMVDLDSPEELAVLYEKSPYANLSSISDPLLVISGSNDDRVGIAHVKDYVLQLFSLGKEITVVIDEDEGHTFTNEESTEAVRYLVDKFLSIYLRGTAEELTNEKVENYLLENVRINSNPQYP